MPATLARRIVFFEWAGSSNLPPLSERWIRGDWMARPHNAPEMTAGESKCCRWRHLCCCLFATFFPSYWPLPSRLGPFLLGGTVTARWARHAVRIAESTNAVRALLDRAWQQPVPSLTTSAAPNYPPLTSTKGKRRDDGVAAECPRNGPQRVEMNSWSSVIKTLGRASQCRPPSPFTGPSLSGWGQTILAGDEMTNPLLDVSAWDHTL